ADFTGVVSALTWGMLSSRNAAGLCRRCPRPSRRGLSQLLVTISLLEVLLRSRFSAELHGIVLFTMTILAAVALARCRQPVAVGSAALAVLEMIPRPSQGCLRHALLAALALEAMTRLKSGAALLLVSAAALLLVASSQRGLQAAGVAAQAIWQRLPIFPTAHLQPKRLLAWVLLAEVVLSLASRPLAGPLSAMLRAAALSALYASGLTLNPKRLGQGTRQPRPYGIPSLSRIHTRRNRNYSLRSALSSHGKSLELLDPGMDAEHVQMFGQRVRVCRCLWRVRRVVSARGLLAAGFVAREIWQRLPSTPAARLQPKRLLAWVLLAEVPHLTAIDMLGMMYLSLS
ncbi:unnamed protein product, partial [Polarella glacialis]